MSRMEYFVLKVKMKENGCGWSKANRTARSVNTSGQGRYVVCGPHIIISGLVSSCHASLWFVGPTSMRLPTCSGVEREDNVKREKTLAFPLFCSYLLHGVAYAGLRCRPPNAIGAVMSRLPLRALGGLHR
jgi:hypothetical protein